MPAPTGYMTIGLRQAVFALLHQYASFILPVRYMAYNKPDNFKNVWRAMLSMLNCFPIWEKFSAIF